jgi:carboxymethylenebutenolidase
MRHSLIDIHTQDGTCPAHVLQPDGNGPWPAALMYMDGIGMRSSLVDMAARLASAGYYVLLPDLFYRVEYDVADGRKLFTDKAVAADWKQRVMSTASAENVMRDTKAFFAHFDSHPQAAKGKIGITGYCMGGRLAMSAAGTFGDRIGAAASYHGGGLATDAPDSPHRRASDMRAIVYVGGAIEDPGFDEAQKARFDEALSEAGVQHTIETYNARHGWVPSDTPVHDAVATERHWDTLLSLFGQALGGGSSSSAGA